MAQSLQQRDCSKAKTTGKDDLHKATKAKQQSTCQDLRCISMLDYLLAVAASRPPGGRVARIRTMTEIYVVSVNTI